MLRNI